MALLHHKHDNEKALILLGQHKYILMDHGYTGQYVHLLTSRKQCFPKRAFGETGTCVLETGERSALELHSVESIIDY